MATPFNPIEKNERIQRLDVLRGFALLGICLMNVEFFNGPTYDFQRGLPPDLTGIDRTAGWFVMVFITGKFWLLFALLFGMGFALMFNRARARNAPFVKTYLRRTLALSAFGIAHAILLWNGDILFGYSIVALMLLMSLFGRPWHWVLAAIVVAAVCMLTSNMDWAAYAAPLTVSALLAPYLRQPNKPWRFWHAGIALYGVFALAQLAGGLTLVTMPEHAAQQTTEQKAAIEKQIQKTEQFEQNEISAFQSPEYRVGVKQRFVSFTEHHMPNNAWFAVMALSMFLIGAGCIQSGVIANPEAHKAFWRTWLWVFPFALVLTAASMRVSAWMPRGVDVELGRPILGAALRMVAAPFMTLGYIALVVQLLQLPKIGRAMRAMAPAGRMALTNYLMQSLICAFVFYGWGLQQWGMPRAQQVLFVCALWLVQLGLSAVWLRYFKYGPMEWLWRWMTYGHKPTLRATPDSQTA